MTEFAAFSLGVQVILAIVALLVVQMTVASEKLTSIGNIVENMADDDAATDGGLRRRRVETSGAKAIGGAGLGAIFGGLFGYTSTIFGGMIFGAIVGDLLDEWSAKRRKRRRLQAKVVEYLLRERVFEPDAVERDTVSGWFPADDEAFVVEAIEELAQSDDAPVVWTADGISLVGAPEAVAYLDRNGGRLPSAFAGPNRPPRPSEESD